MKHFKLNILALILLLGFQGFSQDNIFLSRDFWETKPSPEVIKAKIEAGNDPSEANGGNFDGVVIATLQDAPLKSIIYLQSQKGNDVNKLTHDGRTYIFWAAYKGNVKLMEHLLKQGAKTDVKDDHGLTALNFAANAGVTNTKVYDICLKHGANLEKDLNQDGANALLLAISKDDDLALTKYFVSKGLDINSKDANGNGAFNYVAKTGNLKLMNKLLEQGIKGNDQAFLFAAYGTRGKTNGLEVYQFLEEKGLNPKTTNHEGMSPLHIVAARLKNPEIINYFLNKGLDVNAADHNGNTPFLNATYRNDLKIVELLFDKVKNIDHANKKGETALMLATQSNHPEVVNFLIEKGANINQIDAKGNNLTYYLINSYSDRNKDEFVKKLKLLKTAGLDIKTPQKNGNTWYHLAVEKQRLELLKIASELNQDINAKNSEGNTALILAAMKAKDDSILKFLLEQGADKSITTDFEETVYDLASENELLKKNNISIDFLK
ncbi:ankyrin repeat domain-containing protein [Mangrovimonas cancribranchiae]|uniref:Ankyrin repeat domain-containing protein n=1 Tax=Mangrovimonas cancribranchiae TaxID=3080055 RepID=A0AAU6NWS1_9FLAO